MSGKQRERMKIWRHEDDGGYLSHHHYSTSAHGKRMYVAVGVECAGYRYGESKQRTKSTEINSSRLFSSCWLICLANIYFCVVLTLTLTQLLILACALIARELIAEECKCE